MGCDKVKFKIDAEVNVEESTFEGRSAGIGNLDAGDDVIEPGAFKKTIRERLTRGDIKLLDGHDSYSTRNVWGKAIEAEEKPYEPLPGKKPQGEVPTHVLWTKFFVTRAEEDAQSALRKIEERVLNALSIGYQAIRVEYQPKEGDNFTENDDPLWEWYMGRAKRIIKELKWMETSLVTWGMNPFAEPLPGSIKTLIEQAGTATMQGRSVCPGEVKQMVQALAKLLQGDEERIKQELQGTVVPQIQVPAKIEDNSATAAKDDGPDATVDDKPADAGKLEAAPKADTHEPAQASNGATPAPSVDEEHFPTTEELDRTLALLEVMESQLTI